jgi:hypothetical protein
MLVMHTEDRQQVHKTKEKLGNHGHWGSKEQTAHHHFTGFSFCKQLA